jgi:hypothetical protein
MTMLAKLDLALGLLRELAAKCADCAGTGERRELFEAFLFESDPRIVRPGGGRVVAIIRERGRLETYARGAGVLVSPCEACRPIRQVIETAGGSL